MKKKINVYICFHFQTMYVLHRITHSLFHHWHAMLQIWIGKSSTGYKLTFSISWCSVTLYNNSSFFLMTMMMTWGLQPGPLLISSYISYFSIQKCVSLQTQTPSTSCSDLSVPLPGCGCHEDEGHMSVGYKCCCHSEPKLWQEKWTAALTDYDIS